MKNTSFVDRKAQLSPGASFLGRWWAASKASGPRSGTRTTTPHLHLPNYCNVDIFNADQYSQAPEKMLLKSSIIRLGCWTPHNLHDILSISLVTEIVTHIPPQNCCSPSSSGLRFQAEGPSTALSGSEPTFLCKMLRDSYLIQGRDLHWSCYLSLSCAR